MTDLSRFKLDDKSSESLALAFLRLMDVDLLGSRKSASEKHLQARIDFQEKLGNILPVECRAFSAALASPLAVELRTRCGATAPHFAAMILSEIAVVEPWPDKKVDLVVRRIVLKELASFFRVLDPQVQIDHIVDNELPKRRSFKRIALITLFSVAGGLIAAPHIGAAIGAAMGLSGAAATAAGLASLGFGSVAAGGFGMAGGTIIVGAISGAVGGATSIASAAAKVKSLPEVEALKLRISLRLMQNIMGAESVGAELTSRIKAKIESLIVERDALRDQLTKLESDRRSEKAKEVRDDRRLGLLKDKIRTLKKERIPEIEDEIELLRSSLPE